MGQGGTRKKRAQLYSKLHAYTDMHVARMMPLYNAHVPLTGPEYSRCTSYSSSIYTRTHEYGMSAQVSTKTIPAGAPYCYCVLLGSIY